MAADLRTYTSTPAAPQLNIPPDESCLLVIFGASGDLTKRLLMPSLYNLACDGLLPAHFGIVGVARSDWTTDEFRARMSEDILKFSTRPTFDETVWKNLVSRTHYSPIAFDDQETYRKLSLFLEEIAVERKTGGNMLF